jgi:hypothetical protein
MDAKLKAAMAEARRFLRKAEELAACDPTYTYNPRESGAVRRASMDLTRALADYRRRV